jgi:indolepyruvate ferredoxin oxidoreductase beta subunit
MTQNGVTNILVAGVGGQGVILASDIMADVFLEAGFDVKKSEVHGMAQRGGAVSSHVRFGKKVYSPIIKMGEVDYLFMSEKMETLRWLQYCNPDTVFLIDPIEILPPPVLLGDMEYPDDVENALRANFKNIHLIPATETATTLGNARAANVVMLGTLAKMLEITPDIWLNCILGRLLARFHALNKDAFTKGLELA